MSANFESIARLVTDERLRVASAGATSSLIASESDKGRIINSAPFRRLQQKAQVFPLDPNAAVRTRLTHSIEVAQVGRYLAQKVIEKQELSELPYKKIAAVVNVVESACLLHDIGNPPFGHFGEAAIKDWFTKYQSDSPLCHFDGNPQGFRVISFLNGTDVYGLNLTCALLLSTIKYPWSSTNKPKEEKKIGVFPSDWHRYVAACERLGWSERQPFPFMHLMEAADNISYSMSDLEDGLEKKIIRLDDLRDEFGSTRFETTNIDPFVAFKTRVINDAVNCAVDVFIEKLDEIATGAKIKLLPKSSSVGELLDKVTTFARNQIYSHPSAEHIELAGYKIISGILDSFKPLLDLDEGTFVKLLRNERNGLKGLDLQQRLINLLPHAYRKKYDALVDDVKEVDRRAHLIADFVSGMTDDFALNTYQVLHGIRLR